VGLEEHPGPPIAVVAPRGRLDFEESAKVILVDPDTIGEVRDVQPVQRPPRADEAVDDVVRERERLVV